MIPAVIKLRRLTSSAGRWKPSSGVGMSLELWFSSLTCGGGQGLSASARARELSALKNV